MKILYTILLLSSFLYANIVDISSETVNIKDFKMSLLVDKDNSLSIDDVRNTKFTRVIPNKIALGHFKKSVWYKIELNNSTQNSKKLYLHLKDAYVNSKVTIYDDYKTSIKKSEFDLYNDPDISKQFYGSSLRYEFDINPKDNKTIYINCINQYAQFFNVAIFDDYNSIEEFTTVHILSIFLLSILLVLSVYHVILFFLSRYMEYIYYSCALFFAFIFQLRELGFFAIFGHHGQTPIIISSIAVLLFIIFSLIFAINIFNLKDYKKLNILIKSVIAILTVNILFLLTPFYEEAIILIENTATLAILSQLTLSVYMYRHKHPLAKHYILGNGFYIFFSVVALMFYEGLISYNEITFRAVTIGCVLEALVFAHMLSYMLSLKIDILKERNLAQKEQIIDKSKKEQLGEMIEVISHQLKQPLNVISMSVAEFELKNMTKDSIPMNQCTELFKDLSLHVSFASDTIDDFRHFFNPNKKAEIIDIRYPVNIALQLIKATFKENNVVVNNELKLSSRIMTFGNEIVQVLINILKNASEQFDPKQAAKIVKISSIEDKDYVYLRVEDNAGGIDEKHINQVFDKYFSTKTTKDGSGLGLDLCREIIENRCSGHLTVKNAINGAVFTIRLPKNI
ncbi:sensor histidine kinase [Sulfurimonas sp.]|nr:sensor histidine kinase [Sulfurimonas sp.]